MEDDQLIEIREQIIEKYAIKGATYDDDELIMFSEMVEEHKDLDKYKHLDHAIHSDRHCLIRFLKAFETHERAFKAWVRHSTWRCEFDVESVTIDKEDVKEEHSLGRYISTDIKDVFGRPVSLSFPRYHNSYDRDLDASVRYAVYCLENEISRCDVNIADSLCFVVDMRGFGMSNMDYTFTKRIIWTLHNCYPERLGVCLIVNAPWTFYGCWQLIRPWLNEITASKIIFINSKEQLSDFVDHDQLPVPLFDD